jgi:acyl carrier protein
VKVAREELERFVSGYLQVNDEERGFNEINFIDSGLIDSFGVLSMLMDLESYYSIKFNPIDLLNEEAKTVGGLVQLIINKVES